MDVEYFSGREMASEWALAVVIGEYATWAEVEDLRSGQTCRIIGKSQLEPNFSSNPFGV
jgi:hypothetical protein